MLTLNNVQKIYAEKTEGAVAALKGVSLSFRQCEFVCILGPSGCGKTTLLNIIGGLDRYTDGDLTINGNSTKNYTARDWDTYRNHSVGFIFQSYNLIPHQTVLENVELAMTLGGVSKTERKKRAQDALISVGLKEKMNKKPNELSGGQMQRVSIARALANEPDIILADEPTGALDTETSESVMQLLKEISKTKLVVMVTHNPDLADRYSDRIIKMLDGKILEDSNPCEGDGETSEDVGSCTKEIQYKKKHSSMSLWTTIKLSWRNLMSKKKKTIITSLAASIGVIGMAVILSVSTGMQSYIDKTMADSSAFNYVSISATTSTGTKPSASMGNTSVNMTEYPENTTGIYPYEPKIAEKKEQKLDSAFVEYLEKSCYPENAKALAVDIAYSYNVDMNILTEKNGNYVSVSSSQWKETLHNATYLSDYYTILAKDNSVAAAIPSTATEIALVVDKYNRLPTTTLDSLGIAYNEDLSEIKYTDLIGKEFRIVYNNGWYTPETSNGMTIYRAANKTNYAVAYENEHGITVKIISVLRENADAPTSWLSNGIAYSPELTKVVLENNKTSDVAIAQFDDKTTNVTTGVEFGSTTMSGVARQGGMLGGIGDISEGKGSLSETSGDSYKSMLEKLGYTQTPATITIYPVDVNSRKQIIAALDNWNTEKANTDAIVEYYDMSSMVTSKLGTMVDIITCVLLAFSITSLVISSIMIAIIIYASVIERTKEIGVLRSIGARKKDISRVFEAEAVIIGLISGTIAILIALLINAGINAILANVVGVSTIATLPFVTAIGLIGLSAALLLIASLIPAKIAAKKDPAVALRTE